VGTYSLTYAYNLADDLTSVTDPFGASFAYQRDSQGQVKAVTGSPYAGFTNDVTDVNYRAWGAPKSVSYSDRSSTIAYNARMQPAQFRLTANGTGASIIREDYNYFADGRAATLTDLDDTAGSDPPSTLRYLSRGYSYDHVGRVTGGFGTGTGGVPYNQSYSYDAFGNMTGRSGVYATTAPRS
jgi:YD repeat-containing protein